MEPKNVGLKNDRCVLLCKTLKVSLRLRSTTNCTPPQRNLYLIENNHHFTRGYSIWFYTPVPPCISASPYSLTAFCSLSLNVEFIQFRNPNQLVSSKIYTSRKEALKISKAQAELTQAEL